MTFLIESLLACALFTLFVFLMSRDPIKTIFNYPPAIIERCRRAALDDGTVCFEIIDGQKVLERHLVRRSS